MSQTIRACLWMTGAIISFVTMAIAGRAAAAQLDTFEIMLYRSIIGFVIVCAVVFATGRQTDVKMRKMGWHTARNLSHFAGQNLWFFAITVIPLAQVFALEFTMPIWAILLSAIVLGETLTWRKIGLALFGFTGILVITQPWLHPLTAGVIAAALASIGFAGSAVVTRRLTQTESIASILFWLTVMQAIFGLICAGYDGDIAFPGFYVWPWVLLISCAGLLAHFCLTKALSLAPAAIVMPIDFVRLPLIAVIGLLLYAEPIEFTVIIGAIIIFGANYANILGEAKKPSHENVT